MLVGDTGEVVGVDRAAAAWASRWKGRVPVFAHEFTHCLLMHQQTAAFDEHWRAAVEQHRPATPIFAILARTETADSPAGAFPSSRAPHRPWQDVGRVREVTKSEPRRDDRRARDANPEPSRDPLGQKARPARTST